MKAAFIRIIFHEEDFHQGGHSRGWSLMKAAFIRIIFQEEDFHQGGPS